MSVKSKGSAPETANATAGARRPRADGQRNRERLVETAKAVFAELGADVSLDEIARRTGVGIGTLYRHFPTRASILEAVYLREVEQLAGSASRLLESLPAGEALHAWMRLFVDYIATKKVIVSALGPTAAGATGLAASSGAKIKSAMLLLVDRSAAAGDIRPDADPNDILRALVGFTYGNADPGWQASALRLTDILMDGLRAHAPLSLAQGSARC